MTKPKMTALYVDDVKFKRRYLDQWPFYQNCKDLGWLMGIAIWEPWYGVNMMIFQDGIDHYREQGIDVTSNKVLLHEMQHIAMYRKGLNGGVEPYSCMAEEYGIIDGMRPPEKFIIIKPHWGLPNIPKIAFYSHANPEDYDIEWRYMFND